MTLLRSFIVGLLAVAAARSVCGLLAHRQRSVRRAAWIVLLAPYFTPVLLTGYAYANFSLSLIHHPALNEVFYAALLWWKFTPVAVVILHFTPAPISAEAIHCWQMLGVRRKPQSLSENSGAQAVSSSTSRSGLELSARCETFRALRLVFDTAALHFQTGAQWIFLIRAGCARGPIAAFTLVFLCAFGEFEMASLMGVNSWPVALFDAHAGGLALSESLRRMLAPLLCETAAVLVTVALLARHRVIPARRRADSKAMNCLAGCHLVLALVLVLAIPAGLVLWGTLRGFELLFKNFVLGREILSSLLFAAGATVLASITVFGLATVARHSRPGAFFARTALLVSVCAGLLGPLVLSLAVLAGVQLPGLISVRDTPLPLVFTLALVLVPLALVLKRVLELTGHRTALHLTALMPNSPPRHEIIWTLSTSGKFWTVALLFAWAYWDLTAAAILSPIGMTPLTVRLYNLMHYGQIPALSAMICAGFLAPVLILLLALATRRWWAPQ